ncbi:phytanoyl-CoA dioxygenase family protein [Nemania abortiva]|nr:phytanoyl-CoA dioxygenase family protein [Nemania abortiva]
MHVNMEQAKAHLKEHGWVTIPNAISKEVASKALGKLWEASAESQARGEPSHVPYLDPNAHNVRVFNLMEGDKIFRDLVSDPAAVEMVKSVFGESFLISNLSANIARPGAKSMALHSDQSFGFPEPWQGIWVMNAIWCLSDVTKENGATLYIPGSNKWTSRKDIPDNAPELLVPLEGKAGDLIVMDGRLWHTSGSNVTQDQDRAMLFGYYTYPMMRPIVNWTAKLNKELQNSLSPDLRQWLALDVYGNVPVLADMRYLSEQFPNKKVPGQEVLTEAGAA